jgi:NTE family protein
MDLLKSKNITKSIENEINNIVKKTKKIDNNLNKSILVLAGGGIKGFIYIGVIKYFEEIDILKNINTFIGTSVGGYYSILLSIGYTYTELYNFIKLFDFELNNSYDLTNFFKNYSIDNCDNFLFVFKKLIEKKNINYDITLLELYKKTKKKIILVTTCVNTKKSEYISYETYPELPLYIAMRMTTSIPLLYPPVKYNDKIYVDGGLLDNFPIDYVKDKLNESIGINIIPLVENSPIDNIQEYIFNLIDVFGFINNNYTNDIYKNIVYNIPVNKRNPVDMSITVEEKKQMIKDGYDFIKKYYKN